jgi:hypothetical protein
LPEIVKDHLMRLRWLALLVLCLLACARPDKADAQCTFLPYTFTNGTIDDANQVNANLPPLLACGQTALGRVPHVATNAALTASSTGSYPNGVWRENYAAGLGAPPLWFVPETGTCAANSRLNDGGSCVNTSSGDGNSLYAVFPAEGADMRQWGVKFDGSTDNSTAVAAVLTWAALGHRVLIPGVASPALFSTGASVSLASKTALAIEGAGDDVSLLEYTGTGTAITVTEPGATNTATVHFSKFSLLTNHAGSAMGIVVNYTGADTLEQPNSNSFDMTLRGSDGTEQTNYFGTGISIQGGVSFVNFRVNIAGPSGTPQGTGISISGGTTTGIVYNLLPGTNLSQLAVGLNIGNNTQGYAVTETNFTGVGRGIYIPSSSTNVVQVAVTQSQFGPCTVHCVDDQSANATAATALLFSNNLFFPPSGGYGINIANAVEPVIIGNDFSYGLTPNVGNGINIDTSPSRGGIIANNNFTGMATAITLGTGSQNLVIGPNVHSVDGGHAYITNNATANTNTGPDIWTTYSPTITCGSGSVTITSKTGNFNVVGNTVQVDAQIVVNTSSSCINMNVGLPVNFDHVAVFTVGAAMDGTALTSLPIQLGSGTTQAANLIASVTSAHTYNVHLTYQIVSAF